MRRALTCSAVLAVLAAMLSGCGGGDGGTAAPSGQVVTDGSFEMQLESTANFRRLALKSPAGSEMALVCFSGAKIQRLAYRLPNQPQLLFAGERSDGQSGSDIFVCNGEDIAGAENLTRSAAAIFNQDPAWSPSMRLIAWGSGPYQQETLMVMSADGGSPRTVVSYATSLEEFRHPSWLSETQLVFEYFRRLSSGSYQNQVCAVNVDGTSLKTLSAGGVMPEVSPDKQRIAYAVPISGTTRVCTMGPTGESAGRTILTTTATSGGEYSPTWSPDGSTIYFTSGTGIYSVPATGGSAKLITARRGLACRSVSPEGDRLVCEDTASGEVWLLALGTATVSDCGPGSAPAYSPRSISGGFRTFVGASATDYGATNPPFGLAAPFALFGLRRDALTTAVTITVPATNWSTVQASQLDLGGSPLVAVDVSAAKITEVLEDVGPGMTPRKWAVGGTPATGQVTIFLDAGPETGEENAGSGRIVTVLASSDTVLTAGATGQRVRRESGHLVLNGRFTAASEASAPGTNRLDGVATQVVIDEATGRVISAK